MYIKLKLKIISCVLRNEKKMTTACMLKLKKSFKLFLDHLLNCGTLLQQFGT